MEGSHGWHYCPHQCYRAPECSKAVGHLQLVLPRGRPTMTISPSAVTLLCHVGAKAGHRPWPGGPLDSRGARGAAWLPPTLLMAQARWWRWQFPQNLSFSGEHLVNHGNFGAWVPSCTTPWLVSRWKTSCLISKYGMFVAGASPSQLSGSRQCGRELKLQPKEQEEAFTLQVQCCLLVRLHVCQDLNFVPVNGTPGRSTRSFG